MLGISGAISMTMRELFKTTWFHILFRHRCNLFFFFHSRHPGFNFWTTTNSNSINNYAWERGESRIFERKPTWINRCFKPVVASKVTIPLKEFSVGWRHTILRSRRPRLNSTHPWFRKWISATKKKCSSETYFFIWQITAGTWLLKVDTRLLRDDS